MPNVNWYLVRNFIVFWIYGLCNKYGFTVMLSAGEDILNEQQGKHKNHTHDECEITWEKLTPGHCTIMSTGAVLLADILPTLILNTFVPFILHKIAFDIRHGFICLCQAASYLVVAFSVSVPMSLAGVVIGSIGSGLGGMNLMALASHFTKDSVSAYSSGSGAAGVVGSFAYAGLTEPHFAGLSPKVALLIMLVVPLVFALTYWIIMDHPATITEFSIFRPKSWMSSENNYTMEDTTSLASQNSEEVNDVRSVRRQKLEDMTFIEKLKVLKPMLKYMMPLGLVYIGEYLINQGLTQFLLFDCSHGFSLSPSSQYRWYQVLYQVGVFISRSSINFVKLPKRAIYLLPIIVTVYILLFLFQSIYFFIPHIWIVMVLILFEGLIGGAAYVNVFTKIYEESAPEIREYCMAFAGFADSCGIAIAGFSAIPLHNFICHRKVK